MKKTTVFIDEPDAASLRTLAARLGTTTTRGPGAGTYGNIRALLAGLALAYRLNPPAIEALFADLFIATPTGDRAAGPGRGHAEGDNDRHHHTQGEHTDGN